MESVPIDIGNFLSLDYCHLVYSIVEKNDFHISEIKSDDFYANKLLGKSYKDFDFFRYLPMDIPFSLLTSFSEQFSTNGITEPIACNTSFHRYDENPVKYRANRILKPLIHSLLDDALKQSGIDPGILVDHPVIHFRCSDVPFSKHGEYKLQRYAYFSDCLEKIRQKTGRTFSQITILWYGGHQSSSDDSHACSLYAVKIQEYLTGLGYQVGIKSHSNVEDFAVLFYAPAVISTGGSYSMFAGYFGSGVFFQPQVSPIPVGETADWLVDGYNVEHEEVADYHDVESVIPLLRR
jgi:hypothetical protein